MQACLLFEQPHIMCRVRFRVDGIYLSLPYIELLEEPSYPIREIYNQALISAVPRSLMDKHMLVKDSLKQSEGAAAVEVMRRHQITILKDLFAY